MISRTRTATAAFLVACVGLSSTDARACVDPCVTRSGEPYKLTTIEKVGEQ